MYRHINLDRYYWLSFNDPFSVNDLKKEIEQDNSTIVFSMVWEDYDIKKIDEEYFTPVISKLVKDYILVLTPHAQEQNYHIENAIYVDFFALRTQRKITVQNTKWNSSAKKALLLTGKAEKPHRIGLLGQFYKAGLMDRLEWSLFINQPSEQYKYLVTQSIDFDKFISECTRNPDNIDIDMQGTSSHYGGFPFDVKLYSNTVMSVISESRFNDSIWLTEKTFKAIANKHPFIMAASSGTLGKLKQMGLRTFEKYLQITNYDGLHYQKRLDSIVVNTEYFLDNFEKYKQQINEDVEYNYNWYLDYCKSESSKLECYGILESFSSEE